MSIDIANLLTAAPIEHTYILVLLDNFTRWRYSLPMLNATAETIVSC